MRGSWNRRPPAGYEVVRIRFQNGEAQRIEPFVTGFITPDGERGRPCGNAVAIDGSLLFSDDRNGVLYRVAYTGDAERLAAVGDSGWSDAGAGGAWARLGLRGTSPQT